MCIYCGTSKYRKIYEQHYGLIPREENGRTYEIHHIDGDRLNNNPSNLKAVSIQEHYDIHYSQGDWGACLLITRAMSISPEEKSMLSKNTVKKQIEEWKHPFMTRRDGTSLAQDRVKNGTSPFQKRADGTSIASDQKKDPSYKNPFSKRVDGTSVASDNARKPDYKNPFSSMMGNKHHRYDATVYLFKNEITNDIVKLTQSEFVALSGIDRGSVSRLVRGKYKIFKGWKVVS